MLNSATSPAFPSPLPRRTGRILHWVGVVIAGAGGVAVLVGAVLPWVRFAVFGVPLFWPGALTYGGAAALTVVLFALNRLRAWPLLVLFAGLVSIAGGVYGGPATAKALTRQMVRTQVALAPVNDRLAQVSLPSIEPFSSVGASRSYTGPGPNWTIWGGVGLVVGGSLTFAGGRLGRTCYNCGLLWQKSRLADLSFCPRCGTDAFGGTFPRCPHCRRPSEKTDRFCIYCGTDIQTKV